MDGISFEYFEEDMLVYYAVIKNVEIVGETAYMLTDDFKITHPAIPWKVILGMCHYLVFGYANIDKHELYSTAQNDTPHPLPTDNAIPLRNWLGEVGERMIY